MESAIDQVKEIKNNFEIPNDATDAQTITLLLAEIIYRLSDATNLLESIRNKI